VIFVLAKAERRKAMVRKKKLDRLWMGILFTFLIAVFGSDAMAQGTTYRVLWPRGKKVLKTTPLAKRLPTLEGKTICELWDWIFRGDEIFPVLEKMLSDRYPGVKFVSYKEFGNTHGPEEAKVVGNLKTTLKKHGCDAVISAVGC